MRVVSCVRDPVARHISHLFRFSEIALETGVDVLAHPESAAPWLIDHFHRRSPLTWFEDNVSGPFGVDLSDASYSPETWSFNLVSGGLKLAVVRFEDGAAARQTALGWLFDRGKVTSAIVDSATEHPYHAAYLAFRRSFVIPPGLAEQVYNSNMMRRFYSLDERRGFCARWLGDATPPALS